MKVSLIAAVGSNNELGLDNKLCWNVPEDLRHFRRTTMGKPIIMGSNTFASLNYCTLPGRDNVVLTSRMEEVVAKAAMNPHVIAGTTSMRAVASLEYALTSLHALGKEEVFIIGGAKVYAESLPLVDEMYLTHVHGTFEADTFFPQYNPKDWNIVEEKTYFSTEHTVTNLRLVRTTDEEERKILYPAAGTN